MAGNIMNILEDPIETEDRGTRLSQMPDNPFPE